MLLVLLDDGYDHDHLQYDAWTFLSRASRLLVIVPYLLLQPALGTVYPTT